MSRKIRSTVITSRNKTIHAIGRLTSGGHPTMDRVLPAAAFVEIEFTEAGVYLYRLDSEDNCLADTWHENESAARRQANFEFELPSDGWTESSTD